MGGVNITIQLAAALDRRGVRVSIDLDRVVVHIDGRDKMVIKTQTRGENRWREWSWEYGQKMGEHPLNDYEGAAEAVENFLRSQPGLGETPLLYRMNHMGWTWKQEGDEILQRAPGTDPPGMRTGKGHASARHGTGPVPADAVVPDPTAAW